MADFSTECPQIDIQLLRRNPFYLKPLLEKELDKMVQHKIIRKLEEPTTVACPMAIVKQKGNIRI